MEFEAYLRTKKIDPEQLKQHEPALYAEWEYLFGQMNPKSFTAQKLYLINPLRRQYRIKEEKKEEKAKRPATASKAKPVMKPRIKPAN